MKKSQISKSTFGPTPLYYVPCMIVAHIT